MLIWLYTWALGVGGLLFVLFETDHPTEASLRNGPRKTQEVFRNTLDSQAYIIQHHTASVQESSQTYSEQNDTSYPC